MPLLKPLALAALLATGAAQATVLPPLPIARDDTYLLNSLTLEISAPGVLVNDSGTGLSLTNYIPPVDGTLTRIVTDGSFLYTPARGFAGTTSFQYILVDAFGRSARATVTIDANKSLPVAQDDYYTATAATFSLGAPGLLANDSGGIGAVTLTNYVPPTDGTLNTIVTDGSFRYTADRGFAGVASFDYISVDALGRSARATAHIDYGASIPVAFDDSFTVRAGGTLDILAPGLLANDVGGIGAVTLTNYIPPSAGTLESIVTDGSFRYHAAANFSGTDTFTYISVDELGRSSRATVSIHVTAVPEPGPWLMLLAGLPLLARARRRA